MRYDLGAFVNIGGAFTATCNAGIDPPTISSILYILEWRRIDIVVGWKSIVFGTAHRENIFLSYRMDILLRLLDNAFADDLAIIIIGKFADRVIA